MSGPHPNGKGMTCNLKMSSIPAVSNPVPLWKMEWNPNLERNPILKDRVKSELNSNELILQALRPLLI